MPQSRVGPWVALNHVKDRGRLLTFCEQLNPSVMLGFVGKTADVHQIIELQAELPDTLMVSRVYTHDGDDPQKSNEGKYHLDPADGRRYLASPADCLNTWGVLGRDGRVLNLLNEPSAYLGQAETQRLIDWLGELIPLADKQDVTLCVPNFGSQHPRIIDSMWDPQFDPVLRLLSGSRHYLSFHEYGPAGGVGGINAMVKRCEHLKIKPPRVIITEFGIDHQQGEEDKLRGYRTRHWSGGYYADWVVRQFETTYKPLVESGVLVGMCLYTWADPGGWADMNIEEDQDGLDFQKALLTHHRAGKLSADPRRTTQTNPVVIPVLPKADDPRWERKRASIISLTDLPIVIRPSQNPGDIFTPVGTIRTNEDFYVIEDEAFGAWVPVMLAPGIGRGWVRRESVHWLAIPVPPPATKPSLVETVERWRKAEIEAFNSRIAMFDALIQALQAQA